MAYLSGQPLYCFELCRELKRQGHQVSMLSEWNVGCVGGQQGQDGHFLKDICLQEGIRILNMNDRLSDEYDLCLASEEISKPFIVQIPQTPVINIIHSEYDYETPLPDTNQIIAYVCIRYSIMEHIIKEHQIPANKCHIVYNGVDRKRFCKGNKPKRDWKKVVVPCTLDPMREAFLNDVIDSASEKRRVFLFGLNCGANLHQNEWTTVNPDKFHIEEDIKDADEVAGILLGRVNLEAWSCGVPSRVYNPTTLENKLYDPPIDFDENHNIKNVVKKILGLAVNLDDITVVIPHHTARPQLVKCLESIRNMKYVSIIKGGSFARNVNVGVKTAQTPYVLITNDDTTFNPKLLLRAMVNATKEADIIGATPDQGVKGFDINPETKQLELNEKGHYPSGALLLIKKEIFDKLGGFDEDYINGAEDIDLFLTAEKMGYKVKRIDNNYHHDESQSEGRFDKVQENILYFNKKWQGICHLGNNE